MMPQMKIIEMQRPNPTSRLLATPGPRSESAWIIESDPHRLKKTLDRDKG